ncbi:MAG: hypothetical protein U0169_26705 [Polyangiaceae bacterium]
MGLPALSTSEASIFADFVRVDPNVFAFDAADTLASTLDLRGSVDLASALGSLAKVVRPEGRETTPVDVLRDEVRTRSATIRGFVERPFVRVHVGRHAVPTVEELFEGLTDVGALASSTARLPVAFARSIARDFVRPITYAIDEARAGFDALRRDLAEDLSSFGDRAARLVLLDGLLRAARRTHASALFARLPQLIEREFGDAFAVAHRALLRADVAPKDVVVAWYAPEGFVGACLARSRRLAIAVFEHERTSLEKLVEAACEGAESP